MYSEICLPISLNKTFTYKVPEHLMKKLDIGTLVLVPFKNTKCNGFIVSISKKSSYSGRHSYILDIDYNTKIPSELWKTVIWMSNYYITPIGKVTQLAFSRAFNKKKYKPKQLKYLKLNNQIRSNDYFNKNFDKYSFNQKKLIKYFLKSESNLIALNEIKSEIPNVYGIYKALIKKQVLIETLDYQKIEKNNNILNANNINLTKNQNKIFNQILENYKISNKPNFIHGVTGSGKTEIYIKLVQNVFMLGQSCLILVPEIMLSSQIFKRFQDYFGSNVLLWHSQASEKIKRDNWDKINSSTPYIVVGARSAIFVPLFNIGLIIVDEEHDSSYKESDRQPCFNARDLSIIRSKFSNSLIILGSATPSIETYFNSIKNKFHYLELDERYGNATLPKVELIDLNNEQANNVFNKPLFSKKVLKAIQRTVTKGEQVLILHNRRGYSAIKVYGESDEILKCHSCDIILTYHAQKNHLVCHNCGQFSSYNSLDFSKNIQYLGFGTEQIEFALKEHFPKFTILRMDADSAKSINKQNNILNSFINQEAQILLGTQMIAKGLDIKNITLAIIINADLGTLVPDFKSHEKTYQLISQVIGRSGRNEKKGTALIQTYNKNNPIIKMATNYESKKFYNLQLDSRKALNYPPFSRLIRIIFQSKKEKLCITHSQKIYNIIKSELKHNLLGPFPCPIEKLSNYYRYHILIKIPLSAMNISINKLHKIFENKIIKNSKKYIKILIDVDSNSVL